MRGLWSRTPRWRKAAVVALVGSLALVLLVIVVVAPTGDEASPQRTSPAATETLPEGTCLSDEEERYLVLTFRETVLIRAALGSLAEHFLLVGEQPSLFADDEWRAGVLLALGEVETGSNNLHAIDPPTARTEAIHRHLAAAATHYQEGIQLTARALEKFDADMLGRGANAIDAGGDATDQASAAVQSICAQAPGTATSRGEPMHRTTTQGETHYKRAFAPAASEAGAQPGVRVARAPDW